jgi:hypothetical protein
MPGLLRVARKPFEILKKHHEDTFTHGRNAPVTFHLSVHSFFPTPFFFHHYYIFVSKQQYFVVNVAFILLNTYYILKESRENRSNWVNDVLVAAGEKNILAAVECPQE